MNGAVLAEVGLDGTWVDAVLGGDVDYEPGDDLFADSDDGEEAEQQEEEAVRITVKFRQKRPNTNGHIAESQWPVKVLSFATQPCLGDLMFRIREDACFQEGVHDGTHVRGKVSRGVAARAVAMHGGGNVHAC